MTVQVLRKVALRLADVEEGVACEGTALEKRTVKTKKKAFLFLGRADAMVKLVDSLAEAKALAAKEPERFKAGANGWVTVKFPDGKPPVELLTKWIVESHRVVAGGAGAQKTARASPKTPAKRAR